MYYIEKYIQQNIPTAWISRTFHAGGSSSVQIDRLGEGAAGYIIHAITIAFNAAGLNTFAVNGETLLIISGSANPLPITHNFMHVVANQKSINVTCNVASTTFTVHYQFITNKAKQ